jgi:5-(carboxyamino)imidazole ribonucleotide mutase
MSTTLVGIVIGSASDLPVAEKAVKTLEGLDIRCEVTVASAHRTPEDTRRYAANARGRGLKVLIGIAGLSAALPGVLAAGTDLAVWTRSWR